MPNTGTCGATNTLLVSQAFLKLRFGEGCESATGQLNVCSGALFKSASWKSLTVNPKSQTRTTQLDTSISASCSFLAKQQTAISKYAHMHGPSSYARSCTSYVLLLQGKSSASPRPQEALIPHTQPQNTALGSVIICWALTLAPSITPNPWSGAHSWAGCRSPAGAVQGQDGALELLLLWQGHWELPMPG